MIYLGRAQATTFTTGVSTVTRSYLRYCMGFTIYIIHGSSKYLYIKFRHGFSRTFTPIMTAQDQLV